MKEGDFIDFYDEVDSLIEVRAVTTDNVLQIIGNEVVFFCPDCAERKFVIVQSDGDIYCTDCGFRPDLDPKIRAVVLSQAARLKRIKEFFGRDDVDEYLLNEKNHCSKLRGYLDEVATYLLSGVSDNKPKYNTYSKKGLQRKLSGGKLKTRVSFMSKAASKYKKYKCDDVNATDVVENKAHKNGYSSQFEDRLFFEAEILSDITDPIDKEIVQMVINGNSKTDIAKELGISYQQLSTRLRHIKREMLNPVKPKSTITKICVTCGKAQSVDDFGRDKRKKDGLQSSCRACDALRKKIKKVQENPKKTA